MVLVVLDTNVLVAGLRSRSGASFAVLGQIGTGRFDVAISVPLLLEYEDALSPCVRIVAPLPCSRERDV